MHVETCSSGEPKTLVIDNPSGIGQSARGLVVEPFVTGSWGKVRLVDDVLGAVGDALPVFGCVRGGKAGERVGLHRHSPKAAWHAALPGDYPTEGR